ncbi:hypothetical protein VB005_07649 [Metarhizium brunneum]
MTLGFDVSCYGTIVGDLPRRMGHFRRQATDWHDAPARLTALEWFPRTRPAEEGVGRDAGKDGEEAPHGEKLRQLLYFVAGVLGYTRVYACALYIN